MPAPRDIADLKADVLRGGWKNTYLSVQLQRAEHRNRVLSLVRNGASAQQVSDLLREGTPPIDVTPNEVSNLVKDYLNRIHTEDALTIEQLRVLENERLDALWRALSTELRNPDGSVNLKIVDRMTRLSERRAKMNGIEAAQRHEFFVAHGFAALGLDKELAERAERAWIDVGDDAVEEIGP